MGIFSSEALRIDYSEWKASYMYTRNNDWDIDINNDWDIDRK